MSAHKFSISVPAEMWDQMQERMKKMRYAGASEYIQAVIRHDLATRPSHVISETESAPARIRIGRKQQNPQDQ